MIKNSVEVPSTEQQEESAMIIEKIYDPVDNMIQIIRYISYCLKQF